MPFLVGPSLSPDAIMSAWSLEAKSEAIKKSPDNGQAYKYLGNLYEKNRDLVTDLENWKTYATKDEK